MTTQTFREWAPSAPMGWNSWDCFGASVTEAEVRANATYMAEHLRAAGYEYVVVDIQWSEPNADSTVYHPFADLVMDDHGRLLPAVNRFPSAAHGAGFAPLAADIHELGLKFGIHIMRGIPRQAVHADLSVCGGRYRARDIAANTICPWNSDMYGVDVTKPGGQAYYDDLMALYASWGVDFLKVDDICASTLYGTHRAEIAAIRQAIDRSGRPMVLSLSPGPADLNQGAFLQANANLWRLTDDFWDTWEQLRGMFPVAAKWAPLVRAGNWPDPDMLPLGAIRQRAVDAATAVAHTRFTVPEQMTMLTLWSLLRAPLFLGGDLPQSGEELALVINPDVLAMRQAITEAHQVSATATAVTWQANSVDRRFAAYFNLTAAPVTVLATTLGVDPAALDLWHHQAVGAQTIVPAHGVVLVAEQ